MSATQGYPSMVVADIEDNLRNREQIVRLVHLFDNSIEEKNKYNISLECDIYITLYFN